MPSVVPGIRWPGVPTPAGAAMLAQQWQLERTERLPRAQLEALQFQQLRVLVEHAVAKVPYYARHLRASGVSSAAQLDADAFARWPVLRSQDVQKHAGALQAATTPSDHGAVTERFTTGSTGTPKRILDTQANDHFKDALLLRDHLWHRRDLAAKFAGIHFFAVAGTHAAWHPAIGAALATGPGIAGSVATDVDAQLDWLCRERPAYVLSTASNLAALVRRSAASGRVPAGLRQVMTYTEALPAGLRREVAHTWGVGLADTYSCTEAGALALQCPDHPHYHVQSENVLLEVLRENGDPCVPGETGRVVITTLHNFAMPLIRYEVGDYATPGEPCSCGRTLPVLRSVVGRARNMARDPAGRRFQPGFDAALEQARLPLEQFQFVQRTLDTIEMRYVAARELSADEQARFSAAVRDTLPYPFTLRFLRVASIARQPGGKFEGFVSEVDA